MTKVKLKGAVLSEKDNIGVAFVQLEKDENIKLYIGSKHFLLTLKSTIPYMHKFAIKKIAKDEEIIKQGVVIGKATNDINIGDYVHVHNMVGLRGKLPVITLS